MSATAEMLDLFTNGEMELVGQMPNSSNATFMVTISRGEDQLRGIYKPLRGERPLWDFPAGLFKREVAAYQLSQALGWDLIPLTIARDGIYGEGSVQLFIEHDPAEHYFSLYEERPDLHERLKQMAVFDVIANNTDRKGGHTLLGLDGQVWGIDHGVCFSAEWKLRTVIWDFMGQIICDEMLEPVKRLSESTPPQFSALLSSGEIDAMHNRIDWLLEHRVFPSPESRYEYPWPLL